jgi:hypothetical protein
MVMKKKLGLMPYLQPFGRLGIVTKSHKFPEKWKEKGKKMMLIGYAGNHTGDTYKMFDPIAKSMRLSCNMKWLDWKTPDPVKKCVFLTNSSPRRHSYSQSCTQQWTPCAGCTKGRGRPMLGNLLFGTQITGQVWLRSSMWLACLAVAYHKPIHDYILLIQKYTIEVHFMTSTLAISQC